MSQTSELVARGMGQVRQAFFALVARGSSKLLQLQGYADEVLQEVEVVQQVGFSSHIPKDAKVVVIPLQGKTAKSIVVASKGGKVVIEVPEGETCIYDQFGHHVWLKEDGIHAKGNLFVDGNVVATGDVSDKKSSMQSMRDAYNSHRNGSDTTTPDKVM